MLLLVLLLLLYLQERLSGDLTLLDGGCSPAALELVARGRGRCGR